MSGSAAQRTAIACSFAKPFGSLTPVLPPANAAARQNHRLPNGSFQNIYADTFRDPGVLDVAKWACSRPSNASAGFLSWNRSPSPADWLAALPLEPVSTQPPAANTMQAHWLGHACIMLRIAGATILTDPVFEPRCSPVSFAGPKRVVPAPCTVASLPPIDVVCISHNHYDHLSASTVEQLLQRFGCRLQWVVPLGLAPWLKSCGVQANVVELDLWGFTSPAQHPHLRVTCVPAQHWSNRTNFDRNKSLWCGWAVHDASSLACSPDAHSPAPPPALPPPPLPCFYFTGDTGWSPLLFAEIAATLDSVTLAALPIGAYEPRWFMAPQHTDPGQAVAIHCALRCRQSFGVHWGTWPLTDEPMDEPVTLLSQKAAEAGLPPTAFVALRHGASVTVPYACDADASFSAPPMTFAA